MPIDAAIPLGVQPVKLESPMNKLAGVGEAMKIGEMQRGIETQNRLRDIYSQGVDLLTPEGFQKVASIDPATAIKLRADALQGRKLESDISKNAIDIDQKKYDLVKQRTSDLAFNPSDSNIKAHLEDGILRKEITPQQAQITWDAVSKLDPTQRKNYFTELGVKAETRYQAEVTKRGQDLTDARARDRLAQETATGSLTPETLDMAANVYLKTGQMPPLGFGKSATALRQSVLNRAAQIGGQGADGATVAPADIASNIVSAKQDVGVQTKAVKDFSTGVQGKQVNAFNTAIDHLSTMDKLTDALQGGDVKAFNSIANTVARQTGQPAPTNFDAAKQIVTAEIIKAVVASGGGVRERQEAENNFAAANSPAQLKGVINTYKQLLGGQLNSLGLQYENTTGRKDFDKKLTGDAKKEFSSVRQTHTNVAPKTIKSDAEYDALPPGTTFIDPEGKQRRKP